MPKRPATTPEGPTHDPAPPDVIRIVGARQNNLKGFDLDLPLGKLVVVTGPSGAGKSSLVFDTLHAEGQRRYVETFSAYTRQFLEMLDRPKVDRVENIRPSIAIEQTNTIRTSRSTVGTMTEIADFAKVWFSQVASLHDPDTGEVLRDDHPESIWRRVSASDPGREVVVAFPVAKPANHAWDELLAPLRAQGFSRVAVHGPEGRLRHGIRRLEELAAGELAADDVIAVVQDRLALEPGAGGRFVEAAAAALRFGGGRMLLLEPSGAEWRRFAAGLVSPRTGRRFRPATASLFSFNSPLGACPRCRGFGRVVEIDRRLVIPDATLSLRDGAIRAFQGSIYSESLRDLVRCAKGRVRLDVPVGELTPQELAFVWDGEPGYQEGKGEWNKAWYGIGRFFSWLESNTYKMHVRVFLSKYRAYVPCPACGGSRLLPEALLWKWRGHALPDLYALPVSRLLELVGRPGTDAAASRPEDHALHQLRTRLGYLVEVGLGYLTLDRQSRTLSGGEVERVNLTTCLGTALTDTLFVLDEPSVGLHARDIDRLLGILRRLTDQGNTVVVVEHDEAVQRAADVIVEIGPEPGPRGGHLVAKAPPSRLGDVPASLTGAYLSGRRVIPPPAARRPVALPGGAPAGRRRASRATAASAVACPWLEVRGATCHNLRGIDVRVPLRRFVAITGVSGSGKSTLLDHVLHQGLLAARGKPVEDPASIASIAGGDAVADIVLVDQSPVSRTPRSNPALYAEIWDPVRQLFAATPEARAAGFTASSFSFNAGDGRCETCQGLGAERVEMQFMADVHVPCPACDGRRFKPEVLAVAWRGHTVADVLAMDVRTAIGVFGDKPAIRSRLQALDDVGLGYLPLGQPLHTLSGGESQRLKLVRWLGGVAAGDRGALLLLDEPTTGLHRDDVARLLGVLQRLVDGGHSLVLIEHQMDVVAAADWVLELGPEAGADGGRVVFEGTPEALAEAGTATSPFLAATLESNGPGARPAKRLLAAEPPPAQGATPPSALLVRGARAHNLKDVTLAIEHRRFHVVTGVSGSGKSSLAFDLVFAEGQRRFMESMSAWARQFVEQLPRAEVDAISGIPPTVAIEQRFTRGSRKSTVATITEVAQYLRLLYARVGVPHSPVTGRPLVALRPDELLPRLEAALAEHDRRAGDLLLGAPLVRGRKGHHQPIADWAEAQGWPLLRADGRLVEPAKFRKLDRFKEHDVEVITGILARASRRGSRALSGRSGGQAEIGTLLGETLAIGKGSAFLADATGNVLAWFSTRRTDPATGESFPDLDPKHFSWNSSRGWCPTCRGHGRLYPWMAEHPDFQEALTEDQRDDLSEGTTCPSCDGARLQPLARAVRLVAKGGDSWSLPELLALPPRELVAALHRLELDRRGQLILRDVLPEITERLRFLDSVGLDYLTLDRASNTLSGGEAQRIRLASQLGSNLSGVLYVLDEPSIGLHARDNERLIASLAALKAKGNTLLVVEHDEETMRAADNVIDLGPGAGRHGGRVLASGPLAAILEHPESLTGRCLRDRRPHPRRGFRRPLPSARGDGWLVLEDPRLRNLRGGTLRLPKGRLIGVCGPSGAGKSTLFRDLLRPVVAHACAAGVGELGGADALGAGLFPGLDAGDRLRAPFRLLRGAGGFRSVIEVDQSPIGQTPRSTPATYVGAWDLVRQLYGTLPEANLRGHGPSSFSFNTAGGRCETCKGAGRIKLEMAFLPETWVDCEDCGGTRFSADLRTVLRAGKSISEVLAMSFEEAASAFAAHARLAALLGLMVETGLGYLTLGQSSPTLSGGEAQRLKLVSELAKGLPTFGDRKRGTVPTNLYLLEEPTIGLHLSDTERLVALLHRLVDQGHTVVVIEHSVDLLAECDWLVELGPDGGERGGRLLFQGRPEDLARRDDCPTAPYLAPKLAASGDLMR